MQINSSRSNGYNVPEAGITGTQNHTVTGQSEEICNYSKILEEKREELWTKIMNGQTETTYQIGGQSFTEKEWERLLKRVDTEIEAEEKTNAQELGKQDKKITNREEIMEMMMAGTRPAL